jgi:hypothetical protein
MLATWFWIIVHFAQAQWLPLACALGTLFVWELGRRKVKKTEKKLAEYHEDAFVILAKRDIFLVEAAKERVQPEAYNRAAFFDIIGFRLDFLARKFKRAQTLSRRLGIASLCASSVSSFITGSSLFGIATIGLSFTVTSLGAVCLAIVVFLNADTDAVNNLVLAERIRLELAEYIAGADSYEGLTDDEAYYLVAKTLNGLFVDSVSSQEAMLKAKIAAHNATDTQENSAAQ